MKYIYKSLEFSQQNLGLLLLFIIINSIPLTVTTGESTHNQDFVINSILSLITNIISLFLISGAYSIIWNKFKNNPVNFSLLIPESKKYFCNFLGVSIAIAILGFLMIVVSNLFYKYFFYQNVEAVILILQNKRFLLLEFLSF